MPDRRSNDAHEVGLEYALFLAHTRGVAAGLAYLNVCDIPRAVFWRVFNSSDERRKRERRRMPRSD